MCHVCVNCEVTMDFMKRETYAKSFQKFKENRELNSFYCLITI